jgi:hypothetical protein
MRAGYTKGVRCGMTKLEYKGYAICKGKKLVYTDIEGSCDSLSVHYILEKPNNTLAFGAGDCRAALYIGSEKSCKNIIDELCKENEAYNKNDFRLIEATNTIELNM